MPCQYYVKLPWLTMFSNSPDALDSTSARLVRALSTLPDASASETDRQLSRLLSDKNYPAYSLSIRFLAGGGFKLTHEVRRRPKGQSRFSYCKNSYTLNLANKFSSRVRATVMDYLAGNFVALSKAANHTLSFDDLGGMGEVLCEHFPKDVTGFTIENGEDNTDWQLSPTDFKSVRDFSPLYAYIVSHFCKALLEDPQSLFTFLGFNLNKLKVFEGDRAGDALSRFHQEPCIALNSDYEVEQYLKAKDEPEEEADLPSLSLEEFRTDDVELPDAEEAFLDLIAAQPDIREPSSFLLFYDDEDERPLYEGPALPEFFTALFRESDVRLQELAAQESYVVTPPLPVFKTAGELKKSPAAQALPPGVSPDPLFYVSPTGRVCLVPFYVKVRIPFLGSLSGYKASVAHIFSRQEVLSPDETVLVSHVSEDVAPMEFSKWKKEHFHTHGFRGYGQKKRPSESFTLKNYHIDHFKRIGGKAYRAEFNFSSLMQLLNFTPETEASLNTDFKVLLALKDTALTLLKHHALVPAFYYHSFIDDSPYYSSYHPEVNSYQCGGWFPALFFPEVRELTQRAGALVRHYGWHKRARCNGYPAYCSDADNLVLGTAFLRLFLEDFMCHLYPRVLTRLDLNAFRRGLLLSLFGPWQGESDPYPELISDHGDTRHGLLRLPAYFNPLTSLTFFATEFLPVLALDDYLLDASDGDRGMETPGETEETADRASAEREENGSDGEAVRHLDVTLLFEEQSSGTSAGGAYATLQDFKEDLNPSACTRHLLTLIELGERYPVLQDVLKNPAGTASYEGAAATQVLSEIRALQKLGINALMSRGLHSILRPRRTLSLNFQNMEDTGGGFSSLLSYLDYDASVTLGDMTLTKEDYAELVKNAGRIITFKDRLVLVDARDLSMMEEVFSGKKRKKKKLSLPSVLAAMFGEGETLTPEGDRICFSPKIRAVVDSLRRNTDTSLPQGLNATLRPYQVKGFKWLMHNLKHGLGAVIADDMGLGKTVQVLSALLKLKEEGELASKSALVIMPASLLINWQHEIRAFTPSLTFRVVYSDSEEVTEKRDVWLTTYAYFTRHTELFKDEHFRVLIVDEAQNIKNHRTQAARALRELTADSAIAMTGTPVENHLTDYWAIMDLVNPGLLGTLDDFRSDYVLPIEKHHDENAAKILRQAVTPFVLRRLKTDKNVIPDLPEKMVAVQYCPLTPKQSALYEARCNEALRQYESKMTLAQRLFAVHHAILNLKQICDSPAVYDTKARVDDSGKAMALMDILENVREHGKKVIIFTQFLRMGELLQAFIEKAFNFRPDFLQGKLKPSERQRMIDDFQNSKDKPVLILSLKAGGSGINLTAASVVIHYDLWWNPAVENQATDRAFRIGQDKDVQVYRLLVSGTVEEKIDAILRSKAELSDLTVSANDRWLGDLSQGELTSLLTLSESGSGKETRMVKELTARALQSPVRRK